MSISLVAAKPTVKELQEELERLTRLADYKQGVIDTLLANRSSRSAHRTRSSIHMKKRIIPDKIYR
jgi:hypothetical protein